MRLGVVKRTLAAFATGLALFGSLPAQAQTVAEFYKGKTIKFLIGSGPLSVKAAIESDETLGGIVGSCQVTNTGEVQLYTGGSAPQLFAEWEVEVLARGA